MAILLFLSSSFFLKWERFPSSAQMMKKGDCFVVSASSHCLLCRPADNRRRCSHPREAMLRSSERCGHCRTPLGLSLSRAAPCLGLKRLHRHNVSYAMLCFNSLPIHLSLYPLFFSFFFIFQAGNTLERNHAKSDVLCLSSGLSAWMCRAVVSSWVGVGAAGREPHGRAVTAAQHSSAVPHSWCRRAISAELMLSRLGGVCKHHSGSL